MLFFLSPRPATGLGWAGPGWAVKEPLEALDFWSILSSAYTPSIVFQIFSQS